MRFAVWTEFEDMNDTILKLKMNGADVVEGWWTSFFGHKPRRLEDMRKYIEDNGIWLRSVHAPFGKGYNISSFDRVERVTAVEINKRLIRDIAMIGVGILIVHSDEELRDTNSFSTALSLAQESFSELLAVAEEQKVVLAVENLLPKHPTSDCVKLRRMVDDIDSSWIGICFDTGHAHVVGDMKKAMEILKDRIVTFHIHDNDGARDLHLQPPHGTINWNDFKLVFQTMNFVEPLTIEAPSWGATLDNYRSLIREVSELIQ